MQVCVVLRAIVCFVWIIEKKNQPRKKNNLKKQPGLGMEQEMKQTAGNEKKSSKYNEIHDDTQEIPANNNAYPPGFVAYSLIFISILSLFILNVCGFSILRIFTEFVSTFALLVLFPVFILTLLSLLLLLDLIYWDYEPISELRENTFTSIDFKPLFSHERGTKEQEVENHLRREALLKKVSVYRRKRGKGTQFYNSNSLAANSLNNILQEVWTYFISKKNDQILDLIQTAIAKSSQNEAIHKESSKSSQKPAPKVIDSINFERFCLGDASPAFPSFAFTEKTLESKIQRRNKSRKPSRSQSNDRIDENDSVSSSSESDEADAPQHHHHDLHLVPETEETEEKLFHFDLSSFWESSKLDLCFDFTFWINKPVPHFISIPAKLGIKNVFLKGNINIDIYCTKQRKLTKSPKNSQNFNILDFIPLKMKRLEIWFEEEPEFDLIFTNEMGEKHYRLINPPKVTDIVNRMIYVAFFKYLVHPNRVRIDFQGENSENSEKNKLPVNVSAGNFTNNQENTVEEHHQEDSRILNKEKLKKKLKIPKIFGRKKKKQEKLDNSFEMADQDQESFDQEDNSDIQNDDLMSNSFENDDENNALSEISAISDVSSKIFEFVDDEDEEKKSPTLQRKSPKLEMEKESSLQQPPPQQKEEQEIEEEEIEEEIPKIEIEKEKDAQISTNPAPQEQEDPFDSIGTPKKWKFSRLVSKFKQRRAVSRSKSAEVSKSSPVFFAERREKTE